MDAPDALHHFMVRGYYSGKYRRLIKPKNAFCYWTVRELGETATPLAKGLILTQASVSNSALRGETIVEEMNLKLLQN